MADVTLPQLGETVTEGTITQWFKQVGDEVAADEPLFEVSTDKVDTEVPAPSAGTLVEIRAEEGETVDVGVVVAVIGDAGEAPSSGDEASGADASSAEGDGEGSATPDQPGPEAEQAEQPEQDEAQQADEEQLEAEPAGSTEAPTTQETGPEDEQPSDEQREPSREQDGTPEQRPDGEQPAAEQPAAEQPAAEVPPPRREQAPAGADNRLLSPVVRRLVNENRLDPADITGTGPGGRITRDDVLDHLDGKASRGGAEKAPAETQAKPAPEPTPTEAPPAKPAEAKPAAPAPATTAPAAAAPSVQAGDRDTAVPLSKIRKLTGAHMVMSKSVSPHAMSVVQVDFANVDVARSAAKGAWKDRNGFSLTYLPFIARAVIDALDEFPHLNASVGENELVVHGYVDLGIAVDLDYEGLLAPVIRSAETKRLGAIAKEIQDLASRARNRKLGPDEISGGTLTISNNGSAGSVLTAPIINQPQVAILSTDAIVPTPVAAPLADGTYAVVVHPVGNLAMSWDHRAFDGAYAAGFLKRVKQLLETKDWSGEL